MGGTRAQKPAKGAKTRQASIPIAGRRASMGPLGTTLLRKAAPTKGGSQHRRLPVVPGGASALQKPSALPSAHHPQTAPARPRKRAGRSLLTRAGGGGEEQRTDLAAQLPPKQNNNNQSRGKEKRRGFLLSPPAAAAASWSRDRPPIDCRRRGDSPD